VSTERAIGAESNPTDAAFETRDFYLACFLRCALVNLRAEARRRPDAHAGALRLRTPSRIDRNSSFGAMHPVKERAAQLQIGGAQITGNLHLQIDLF
jgi:hypothetical protein